MTDYVTDFVQESEEQITELNNALLALERSPNDDEAMERIFRIAHTLKGNCGAMGIEPASDLAHAIEDLLDAVRSGETDVSAEVMDGIFDAVDELESMIVELAADGEIETDPSATIDALRSQLERKPTLAAIEPPTSAELESVCGRFEPPANPDHDAYLARLAIAPHDEINYGVLVVEALIDAFDLIGTDPPRREIEADDYGNSFDAVFATPVGEAAIASGLEPVEEVDAFELVAVTDRLVPADGADDADLSTDEANELEVDDLLAEFDEFDNLDERADEFDDDDLDPFDEMGDAGSFDDLLGDAADDSEPTSADPVDDADSTAETADADADEPVDDAGAVFDELKDEVEMVGFDELQDELAELEFDEFDDDEEVSMAELLGEDDDDSFLDDHESERGDGETTLENDADDSSDATDDPGDVADDSSDAADDPSDAADESALEAEVRSVESDALERTATADDDVTPGDDESTPAEPAEPADPAGAEKAANADARAASEPAAETAETSEDDATESSDEPGPDVEPGSLDESEPPKDEPTEDEIPEDEPTEDETDPLEESLEPTDSEGDEAVSAEPESESVPVPESEPETATDADSSVDVDDGAVPDEGELSAADPSANDGIETEASRPDAGAAVEFDESAAVDADSSADASALDPDSTDPLLDDDAVPGEEAADTGASDSSDDAAAADLETTGFGDEEDEFGSFDDADLESVEFDDADLAPDDAFDHGVETDVNEFETTAAPEPLDPVDGDPFGMDDDGEPDNESSAEALSFEDDAADDFEATFGDPFADDGSSADLDTEFDDSLESEDDPADAGFGAEPDAFETDASSGGIAEIDIGSDEPIVDEPELIVPEITVPDRSDRGDDDERTDETQSVRVDVEQIDSLLTLVEGLVTSRVRLRHAIDEGEDRHAIAAELDDLEDLTTELQETVTNVRLVPLQTVTSRLPRVVRDIAREQDKDVSVEMVGETVELDRGILDRIGDPLIHLVRNAVDHGIESPERREAADKSREGSVTVSAERARDRVTITVADDGSGLDPDRLRAEAVEADVLTDAEADDLADDAAYDLIFHPGLSTADEVTDVSGRGVGMDVVSRTIEELDGTVTVDSDPGEGTTVTMTLPVSIAIDDVLFLESGGEEFGIPIKAVRDIEAVDAVDTDGDTVADADGGDCPVVSLAEALETPADGANGDGMIVRIRDEVGSVALHCDRVHGQQEVVVTPFEGIMRNVPGVSGATVRGRGEVVTILDVPTL